MEISGLLIRIVFLLMPGIIAYKFYRTLMNRKDKKDWEDFIEILLYSLLSYMLYGLVNYLIYKVNKLTPILDSFFIESIVFNWIDILIPSIIGVILSIINSLIKTYNIINRFGQFIKVTKYFGEEDVWEHFHNLTYTNKEYEWFYVRDHKLDLIYFGSIKLFSNAGESRELLMQNVAVYDKNSNYLYDVKEIYFSRDAFDLTIEVCKIKNQKEGGGKSE